MLGALFAPHSWFLIQGHSKEKCKSLELVRRSWASQTRPDIGLHHTQMANSDAWYLQLSYMFCLDGVCPFQVFGSMVALISEATQMLALWGARSLISFVDMNMHVLLLLRHCNKYLKPVIIWNTDKISCCLCSYAVTNSGLQFQMRTKAQRSEVLFECKLLRS